MPYLFVGLGNPGEKYQNTRHNAGRLALLYFCEREGFSAWRKEKKADGLVSDGTLGSESVTLLLPETFMNLSGRSVSKFVGEKDEAQKLVVLHDEIDLPLGHVEIAYGKGSGGHNGVQSVTDDIETKNFVRIRIGVCPLDWFGHAKKPRGKDRVSKFLLSDFKKGERQTLETLYGNIAGMLEAIVREGRESAMNAWNEKEI